MAGLRFNREMKATQGRRCPRRFVRIGAGLCFSGLAFAGVAFGAMPSATVPPSTYQSGLINTPNPIDNSANLPITGNVLGGKHFRGNIPYGSTNSFQAPLGSTSLDSFLRYSAIPQTQGNYSQNYTPYYSPSGSVATTMPGYQGVFSPSSPRIAGGLSPFRAGQSVEAMPMAEVPQPQIPIDDLGTAASPGLAASPRLRYWPMSPSPGERKDILADEFGDRWNERPLSPTGEPLMTPQEYQQRLEKLRQNIDRIQTGTPQVEQSPNGQSATTPATVPPLPQVLQANPPADGRIELYDPSASQEATAPMPPAEAGQAGDAGPIKLPALQRIEETSRAFDATSRLLRPPTNEQARDARDDTRAGRDTAEPGPAPTPARVPPQATGAAAEKSANAGSLAQKQFDHYLAAAQVYMQQGRYYRAVDSFALASVYIPQDPRPHLGKSHALLAAGEYVSSARSLARAIELDARYALAKVDLVEVLGGPDAFVQRITNLEEKARAADASQLQFLLAYVYLQMDQPAEARTAIDAARNGLPSSTAADLLETVIQAGAQK